MRIIIAIVVLFIVVALGAVLIAWPSPTQNGGTPSHTPSPQPFVSENVIVTDPLPNVTVPQTFTVRGQARGSWFFEASFPLKVRDADGNPVGFGIAETTDNWMTTEFVPFEGKVEIANYSGPATLVLLKDNPSGLPDHDDSVEFPVVIQ